LHAHFDEVDGVGHGAGQHRAAAARHERLPWCLLLRRRHPRTAAAAFRVCTLAFAFPIVCTRGSDLLSRFSDQLLFLAAGQHGQLRGGGGGATAAGGAVLYLGGR
jgi:hypothetical protein